jgi:hypothetical protein
MLLYMEQPLATFGPITGRTPADEKYQPQIEGDNEPFSRVRQSSLGFET